MATRKEPTISEQQVQEILEKEWGARNPVKGHP